MTIKLGLSADTKYPLGVVIPPEDLEGYSDTDVYTWHLPLLTAEREARKFLAIEESGRPALFELPSLPTGEQPVLPVDSDRAGRLGRMILKGVEALRRCESEADLRFLVESLQLTEAARKSQATEGRHLTNQFEGDLGVEAVDGVVVLSFPLASGELVTCQSTPDQAEELAQFILSQAAAARAHSGV